jgi:hypothetical protein
MKNKLLLAGILGLALSGASGMNADTLSVGLSDFAVIRGSLPGNAQASRIVVAVLLSGLPSQSEIDYAEVSVPYFLPTGFTGTIQVEARPITRSWDKNSATWTVPWQRAGGDFDTTRIASFTLGKVGAVPVRLDVTDYVAGWADGRNSNFGMLLKRPVEEGDAFRAEIADLQRVLSQVRLKVYYHGASLKGNEFRGGGEVSR